MKEFVEKLIGMLEEERKKCLLLESNADTEINGQYFNGKRNAFAETIEFTNQLAEEYNGEELRKSQKIYNFIEREINPYGKPFEGTVYEFGLKVMKYIRNLSTEEYNNGFCEWKLDGVYLLCQHNTELVISCLEEEKHRYTYCPYCGKKIKVVE